MKTRHITFDTESLDIMRDFVQALKDGGFSEVHGRCPNGTKDKVAINIRRWCGEWSGWQTFKNEFVYAR